MLRQMKLPKLSANLKQKISCSATKFLLGILMQQDKVAEALSKSDSREYRLGTEALSLLCQYFSANCGSYVFLYILLWYFVCKSHITSIVGIACLHLQLLLFLRDVFGRKTYA